MLFRSPISPLLPLPALPLPALSLPAFVCDSSHRPIRAVPHRLDPRTLETLGTDDLGIGLRRCALWPALKRPMRLSSRPTNPPLSPPPVGCRSASRSCGGPPPCCTTPSSARCARARAGPPGNAPAPLSAAHIQAPQPPRRRPGARLPVWMPPRPCIPRHPFLTCPAPASPTASSPRRIPRQTPLSTARCVRPLRLARGPSWPVASPGPWSLLARGPLVCVCVR